VTLPRFLYVAAWIAMGALIVFLGTNLTADAAPGVPSCEVRPGAQNPPDDARPGNQPVLKTDDPAAFFARFGDSRRPTVLFTDMAAFPELTPRDWLAADLSYLRSDEGRRIAAAQDGLKPIIGFSNLGAIKVCLIVKPRNVGGLAPGRYKGTIAVKGEVEPVSLPVELSFRTSHWVAIVFASLGVFFGVVVKAFSEAAAARRVTGTSGRQALKAYVSELSFPVALILAAIGGWIIFLQLYGADDDWGANGMDRAKLFAACFLIQMSSSEGIALISRFAGPPMPGPR
jgi:hypothetical protein